MDLFQSAIFQWVFVEMGRNIKQRYRRKRENWTLFTTTWKSIWLPKRYSKLSNRRKWWWINRCIRLSIKRNSKCHILKRKGQTIRGSDTQECRGRFYIVSSAIWFLKCALVHGHNHCIIHLRIHDLFGDVLQSCLYWFDYSDSSSIHDTWPNQS